MPDEAGEKAQEPRVQADEDWKKAVAEEKARLRQEEGTGAGKEPGPGPVPEADLRIFLAGLYTQTLMCLGDVAHPATGEVEKSLPEAQYLIDTIAMLKDKTKGNLTPEEAAYIDGVLYDLRMRYVSASARERTAGQGQEASTTKQ